MDIMVLNTCTVSLKNIIYQNFNFRLSTDVVLQSCFAYFVTVRYHISSHNIQVYYNGAKFDNSHKLGFFAASFKFAIQV